MIDEQQPAYVGPLEPFDFTISDQVQGQYLEALEDHHERYTRMRPDAAPLLHPGILLSHSNATRSPSFSGPNVRWIHMREKTHFTALAHLDDELTARWRVVDHKQWFGRALTCVSCVVTRRDEQEILRRTMWGLRASTRRMVSAADNAVAETSGTSEAKPSTPLARSDYEISGQRKSVTSGRIGLFSGGVTNNLHTDDQIAKKAGLAAPVASASQGMGYLCELMIDYLGEEWLAGGDWALTFRKPIFAGDHIGAFGRLGDVEPARQDPQRTMDIRLVNQHGLTVTDGSATSSVVFDDA